MWAYLQVSLNHVWEQELSPAPGEKAPPRPTAARCRRNCDATDAGQFER